MIFQTEKQLQEIGDKIPADKKAPIENALKNLKEAYEKKDADECERYVNELTNAFQAASAEMYNAAGAQGGQTYNAGPDFSQGAQGGSQQNGNGKDDVTDVDFEEVK